MRDRRIGTFFLPATLIDEAPGQVRELLGKCIVVKCEFEYSDNGFKYTAINSDFCECYEGAFILNYDIVHDEKAQQLKFDIKEKQ